jgi:hypothetical protein
MKFNRMMAIYLGLSMALPIGISKPVSAEEVTDESTYLSVFFETPLSEIEEKIDVHGEENPAISLSFSSDQMKMLIDELETQKDKIGSDSASIRKATVELLFDKLHIKDVYDLIDPEYINVTLSWEGKNIFELDTDSKKYGFLDLQYNVLIHIYDNPDGYSFDYGENTINKAHYEVAQRMLYFINTYSDKNFFTNVYAELPSKSVSSVKLGDVDCNGTIDVTDLTELSLALLGDNKLTEVQQKAADIDSDNLVTLADLARLQQYLSKKITSF